MASSDYYIADNSDIENRKLEAAKNHYGKGDYQAALRLYLSMLNTSVSYKLYFEIGRCYYKLEDMTQAEEYFQKSIALESMKNPSYVYLGNIAYKETNLTKAIENWAYAYSNKPDDEAICLNLATSYFSKGMKFQSVFYYEKYLKYAKDKSSSYSAIKDSIDKCSQIGLEFLQKAQRSISRGDNKTAIEYLNFAIKNLPVSFDINFLLGKVYLDISDYMHAMIYLKQALCINKKSLDVLQNLASACINLGDYTGAYCAMKRLLPLLINNQPEYIKTIRMIKELEASFDSQSSNGHYEWGNKYYEDNNYHMALLEYENCLLMTDSLKNELEEKIERIKSFINPEERIVKSCIEKGDALYLSGQYTDANKYFSKVIKFSSENSGEYKLAKSKMVTT